MKKYLTGASAIAVSAALISTAHAQVDTIVVTATKRAENAQDIPVAVQALGSDTLDELRVDNFSDYLTQLPGVTAGGSGPGQNTIYIRGVASTTPNLTVAGVAGLAPNVALYLDDQPLSQPGRNLDVYAVDLERVEVLSGPQGTLFGASSQAGTVRLITNKPKIGEFEAIANAGVSFTKDGEMSQKFEAIVNIPIADRLAVRAVGYIDDRGGYIDNVPGTIDARESARFRDAGVVRANGVPVSSRRAGVQSPTGIANALAAGDTSVGSRIANLENVTFLEANNAALVEEDFNDTTYTGFRISARYELNDDWTFTASHARQSLESDGVFFSDPDLDELEIQRYEDDRIEDDFNNTSWTLEGRLGALEAVYTGAFTDRDTDQRVDYTDYLFVGQYFTYYICDDTVSYPEYYASTPGLPEGTCQAPNAYVNSASQTHVFTHELRFNTPEEYRLRGTFGAFYSDLTLTERNDFTYPGSTSANIFGSPGFFPNFPYMSGYFSDPGPFPEGVIFRNDVRRTDEQFGVFGEANFDIVPDRLTITFGARYYNIDVDLEGSANSSFGQSFQQLSAFGTDISDLFDGDGQFTFRNDSNPATHITFTEGQTFDEIKTALNAVDPFSVGRGAFTCAPNAICDAEIEAIVNALNAPDKASTDGFIFKANISWTPVDGVLLYATYSEGFRPGLLNRPGGAPGPNGFVVPFELDTDEVKNYEIGWKTNLFDNQLQFNANAFFVDVKRLQTTIFDPSIVNLFFSANAADAEVYGFEGDFIVAPESVPGLTIAGAFSVLDTEITKVLIPTDDVVAGKELAYAPNFSGNLRMRYEWDVSSALTAHVMPQIIYSGSSRSDIIEINAIDVDDWFMFNMSAGVTMENWSFEIFGDNLTDQRAELTNNFVFDRERVTTARPLTVGARISVRY